LNNAVLIYSHIPFGIFMLIFAIMSFAFLSGDRLDQGGYHPIIKLLIRIIIGAFAVIIGIISIPTITNGIMLLEKNVGLVNLPIIKGFTTTIAIMDIIVTIIVIYCYFGDGLLGIIKSLPVAIGIIVAYPAFFFFVYFIVLFFINLFKYSLSSL